MSNVSNLLSLASLYHDENNNNTEKINDPNFLLINVNQKFGKNLKNITKMLYEIFFLLTRFEEMFNFYSPSKHQKVGAFPMFPAS